MDADARLDAAVGSVAEEAARLLEALGRQTRTTDAADSAAAGGAETRAASADGDAAGPQGHQKHVHVAMGDAESCTWCPVCRSVTALRAVSPETLTRLADLATTAATLLGELATRHTEGSGAGTSPRPAPAERTPRTEPIAVVDEEDTP
ncbi:hypothetical protein N798_08095 [Knoellia flava TL1]|uniref:Uncharacterized protein n=2 Tax=Knoellia flava TaxID=913969 RepID=A0A8H9FXR5_9MICO|nr:hypothetical protein [Knoellia flava]KGN31750.1 hypothetical protein N798_08095 [Knoellia flava TL1]GGB90516.1 hypothetical protein GCM10011314_32950 [Knoellia flava]